MFNDFCLTYADNNRNQLRQQYSDAEAFNKGFAVTDELMKDFLSAAYKAGVKEDSSGLAVSRQVIEMQVKALIARNLWDLQAYFIVINKLNQPLQRAISAIRDNSFEKMKLGTGK